MSDRWSYSPPPSARLADLPRRLLYLVISGLWLSGVAFLFFRSFVRTPGELGPQHHWLEGWWLRGHGLATFGALLLFGPLLFGHIPIAWRMRRNRPLGLALSAVSMWLIVSGYGLYYFSDTLPEGWLSTLHWVPGIALPLMLVGHIASARRSPGPRTDASPRSFDAGRSS